MTFLLRLHHVHRWRGAAGRRQTACVNYRFELSPQGSVLIPSPAVAYEMKSTQRRWWAAPPAVPPEHHNFLHLAGTSRRRGLLILLCPPHLLAVQSPTPHCCLAACSRRLCHLAVPPVSASVFISGFVSLSSRSDCVSAECPELSQTVMGDVRCRK